MSAILRNNKCQLLQMLKSCLKKILILLIQASNIIWCYLTDIYWKSWKQHVQSFQDSFHMHVKYYNDDEYNFIHLDSRNLSAVC